MSRKRELYIEVEAAGRVFTFEDSKLQLTANDPEILDAYFATAKIEKEYEGEVTEEFYVVKSGDGSLSKIAKKNGTTVAAIIKNNSKITNANKHNIKVGQKITLSSKKLKGEKVTFKLLDSANLGDEVYVVVKTDNLQGKIVGINVAQGIKKGIVEKEKAIWLQQDDKDVYFPKVKVGEFGKDDKNITNKDYFKDLAVFKIKLGPKDKKKKKEYKDALEKLSDKKTKLFLLVDAHSENGLTVVYNGANLDKDGKPDDRTTPNYWLDMDGKWFEVSSTKVIDIYHDGKISKVDLKDVKKIAYVYHDKDGNEHDLGTFDIIEVDGLKNGVHLTSIPKGYTKKEMISNKREKYTYSDKIVVKGTTGDEKGKIRKYIKTGKKVSLVKVDSRDYTKQNTPIQFNLKTGSTRPYINPNALACMLGSIAEVGYKDITLVGFTGEDNHGFPSTTHVNGKNGDFRYLRTDKTGGGLNLFEQPKKLDVVRQEKMIDAFNNFGWRKFYSVKYTIDKKKKILKLCDPMVPHHHHLHSRRFEAKYKK